MRRNIVIVAAGVIVVLAVLWTGLASAHSGDVIVSSSSSSSPTLDGIISTGEWNDAASLDIGSNGKAAMLYAKNDASYLYLAINAEFDGALNNPDNYNDPIDGLDVYIDSQNSGISSYTAIIELVGYTERSTEQIYIYPVNADDALGSNTFAASDDSGNVQYEIKIDIRNLNVPGKTSGIGLDIYSAVTADHWDPLNFPESLSDDPATWADISFSEVVNGGPGEDWNKTFGTVFTDTGYSVQQTSDGGYIIAGAKGTSTNSGGGNDAYLIKTYPDGNEEWSKIYGGSGVDQARSVQQTSDGGYILTGYTYSQGAGQSDVYLVKTYPDGNEEWSRTFGGSSYDEGYSVQQTSDGGYIITGRSLTYGGLYLVKTYPDGTEKWSKTYENNDIYIGYDVKQTLDGGYIIASGSPFSKNPSGSRNRMYILKTDSLGNKEWDKFIWQAESGDATAILQVAEDSFIVAGFTTETVTEGIITYEKVDDMYLAKLKVDHSSVFSMGETNDGIHVNSPNVYVEWDRTYGGTEADVACDVQQTSDGGYILAGHTRSLGAGKTDAFVVKTDSDGIEMWSKAIGGIDWDNAHSVKQTSDGGYIVAGSTESFGYGKGGGGLYDDDVWLIKLGAGGSGTPDSDGDGVPDDLDNCPNTPNPGQIDNNKNGVGDMCEIIEAVRSLNYTVRDKIISDTEKVIDTQVLVNKEIYSKEEENLLLESLKFSFLFASTGGKVANIPIALAQWAPFEVVKNGLSISDEDTAKILFNTYTYIDIGEKKIEFTGQKTVVDMKIGDVNDDCGTEVILHTSSFYDNSHYLETYKYNRDTGEFENLGNKKIDRLFSMDLGDTDGDGEDEIITREFSSDKIIAYDFTESGYQEQYVGDSGDTVIVRDICGDKKDEIISIDDNLIASDTLITYEYTGSGYRELDNRDVGSVNYMRIGDVDGDGKGEVVLLTSDEIIIYKYTGFGYQELDSIEHNFGWAQMEIGDIDNNGKDEIVLHISDYVYDKIVAYNYTESGCQELDGVGYVISMNYMEIGDVDNDGENEIVLRDECGNIAVYEYTGSKYETLREFKDTEGLALSIAIGDTTNSNYCNLVIANLKSVSSQHFEPFSENEWYWESYLFDRFRNFFYDHDKGLKISQKLGEIESECSAFENELDARYPNGLPEDYPTETILAYVDRLNNDIRKSMDSEITTYYTSKNDEIPRPIKLGTISNHKKQAVFLKEELDKNVKEIEIKGYGVVGALGTVGLVKFAYAVATHGFSVVSEVILSTTAGVVMSTTDTVVEGTKTTVHGAMANVAALSYIALPLEIDNTTKSFSDSLDYILDPSADSAIRIVGVSMPNIILEGYGDIGYAEGSVTVENTGDESINANVFIDIYGPPWKSMLEKPVISIASGESIITIPSGETMEIPFKYGAPKTSIWGECTQYDTKVWISHGTRLDYYPKKNDDPVSFCVGSEVACNQADRQNIQNVLNGNIREGESAQTQFTTQSDTRQTEITLFYEGSDLDLHLYDSLGRHTGLNYQTGEIETDIPGVKYLSPDINPEVMIIEQSGGKNYNIEVVGIDVDDIENFIVVGKETPEYIGLLDVSPSNLTVSGSQGDSIEDILILNEYGNFNDLNGISITASDLTDGMGGILPSSSLTFDIPTTNVPAGSEMIVNLTIDIPTDAVEGRTYSGIITAEDDSGAVDIAQINININPVECPLDMNDDSYVNAQDIVYLLTHGEWGNNQGHVWDLNDDGYVNAQDVVYALTHGQWGACP